MTYIPPRVTYVGSDPKIPALRKAIERMTNITALDNPWNLMLAVNQPNHRFIRLWQARNRRTRVLMWKVTNANDAR